MAQDIHMVGRASCRDTMWAVIAEVKQLAVLCNFSDASTRKTETPKCPPTQDCVFTPISPCRPFPSCPIMLKTCYSYISYDKVHKYLWHSVYKAIYQFLICHWDVPQGQNVDYGNSVSYGETTVLCCCACFTMFRLWPQFLCQTTDSKKKKRGLCHRSLVMLELRQTYSALTSSLGDYPKELILMRCGTVHKCDLTRLKCYIFMNQNDLQWF